MLHPMFGLMSKLSSDVWVDLSQRALNAFRITATSNTSCNNAPYSCSMYPRLATQMRAKLAPNPIKIPCLAILVVKLA